ncbi:MAG: POTRA domain-containing protein, partial [Pseudomonadota bacterium]
MQRIATYTFFFLWLCCATAHALETCIVDIRGISPIYENNVRAALSLLHMDPTAQISEPHIQALAVKGVGEAKTALVPFGYLQPEITVTWQQSQEQWIVLYDVVPGQATVVKTLQVLLKGTVTNDPYLKDMSSFHYLHPGDVMNHVLYEQMKVDLLDEAVRQGYLDARWVQHEVQISPNLRDAHIYLHLDLGTPYTIESIDINKNYFNTHFLTGFLNVHVGDRYIIENILSTQSRLNSNG